MDTDAAEQHLTERYPDLAGASPERMVNAIASSDRRIEWRDLALRWYPDLAERPPATAEDAEAALVLLARLRTQLDDNERDLINIARDRNLTWRRIAHALGHRDSQGAQQRRKRLGDRTDSLLDPSRRQAAPQPPPFDRAALIAAAEQTQVLSLHDDAGVLEQWSYSPDDRGRLVIETEGQFSAYVSGDDESPDFDLTDPYRYDDYVRQQLPLAKAKVAVDLRIDIDDFHLVETTLMPGYAARAWKVELLDG